jgi:hypothetical protein
MIVGFTPAAGKNNLRGTGFEEIRNLSSGMFNSPFGRLSCPVMARRITEVLGEEWLHRLSHFRSNRSACVEIKVNLLNLHKNSFSNLVPKKGIQMLNQLTPIEFSL